MVTREPGPAWDNAKPTREQSGWDAHAAFMDGLADERFVAFGGPAGGDNRVVLIVDAEGEAAIHDRLEQDPWPAELLRTVSIEPWTNWLGGDERIGTDQPGSLYLVSYAPGRRWEEARARRLQAGWDAHAAFMDALDERHVVSLGGPLDERRALLVVRAADQGDAMAQLSPDPWLNGTLIIESVEEWTLWLCRSRRSG
ncbi:MAG: hypothetical protein ACRDPA_15890 [Solirubrobacteraceae bacterium]